MSLCDLCESFQSFHRGNLQKSNVFPNQRVNVFQTDSLKVFTLQNNLSGLRLTISSRTWKKFVSSIYFRVFIFPCMDLVSLGLNNTSIIVTVWYLGSNSSDLPFQMYSCIFKSSAVFKLYWTSKISAKLRNF